MRARSFSNALVLCALAWTSSCGDPRDVQVPVVPERTPETLPVFARAPAQAYATVRIQTPEGASPKSCPLNVALAVGASCDQITSPSGMCDAVRNGKDAAVQCYIGPLNKSGSVRDVDLLLEHALLP